MILRKVSAGHYMTRDGRFRVLDTPEGWKLYMLLEGYWVPLKGFRTFKEARMSVRFITGK